MNTGILSNPAPSNGYDAVLAALAPHAAPAEGSLGGTTPSVHNRVKQTFINPVATYPFIARKWKANWEQSFHEGDLMFVFTGRGATTDAAEAVHTRRHTVLANLPVLNHIMRLAHNGDTDYEKFKEPESWAFIGVMRNSSAASGLQPRGVRPRGGNALVPDRIINIDVRGATRMFNYWQNARAGSHLWLAWRELTMGGEYARCANSMATGRPLKRNREGNVDEFAPTCWQLLPITDNAHNNDYRPLKVWWSEQTIAARQYRRPICAGWVFQGIGAGEVSDNAVAIRKATQISENRFRLPMVNAFLHV